MRSVSLANAKHKPLLIYVHGFNSSPESWKAQQLQQYLSAPDAPADLLVPNLSHWPAEAVRQLGLLMDAAWDRDITLIGSSLGGFYSTWLTEQQPRLRSVLVNPAVNPDRLLADWLGENENIYTHERYHLTREHLKQLQALRVEQLSDPSRYLLLVQTADETLDYREAVEKYQHAVHYVQPGGSHGFEAFDRLIPAVVAFAQGRVELPPLISLPEVVEG
ncbi:YqiA/YcfP family alpha/beta fold hydrolase [Nitrincola sp.]|uniref:YqiA/YcfP family alpha/beta fold hydrolase n=1 Tax=Nitrincola sp. TaxID=1926584 RepID=UPI003A93D791